MKKLYKISFIILFPALLLYSTTGKAQCVNGQTPGTTAFDTTVAFGVGITTKQIKFPKFDPQTAMLSCVKLVVTMVGVVNYVGMQNLATTSNNQADFYYNRGDNMSGPGLTPALSNNFNGHYGPYNLAPNDNIPGPGPDFQSITNDTVLRKVMTRTLTDSLTISKFYGTDSLVYNYDMSLFTSASFTADNSSSVSTSALVNFRLEYCTCPMATLPVGLKNFSVVKSGSSTASVRWEAETGSDNYFYQVGVSRDGRHFTTAGTVNKMVNIANPSYLYPFSINAREYGRYYFRIKQQWFDGYFHYSEIRSVDYANPLFSSVSIYPNPSSGNVGIKFVAAKAGKYLVQVSNAGGQVVASKEVVVAETTFKQIASLQKGLYYVKITELSTQSSYFNQLIVQ